MRTRNDKCRNSVVGQGRLWQVTDRVWRPVAAFYNDVLDSWGFGVAMAFGKGQRAYRIQAMYLEFENVDDPDAPIAAPTFSKADGLEYYNDLAFSGTRDYLRVALVAEPVLGIWPGYEDRFTEGVNGNRLTFFAMSQGTQGVHGKEFSDAVNSKVFGAALVSTPRFEDATQDVLFSRSYFEDDAQQVKLASSQIGLSWDVGFLRTEA